MKIALGGLVVGALAIWGCGDADGQSDGPPVTTASGTGGGEPGAGGEGGVAMPDPPETVIVKGPNGLEEDVAVVVHDATGAALSVGQTNASGELEVNVPPGGAVTALSEQEVFSDDGSYFHRTVLTDYAVPQGSTVTFQLRNDGTQPTSDPMTVMVHLADYPVDAATTSVWACGARKDYPLYYPAVMDIEFAEFHCSDEAFHVAVVLWDESGEPMAVNSAGAWPFNAGSTFEHTFDEYDYDATTTLSWAGVPQGATPSASVSAQTSGRPVLYQPVPASPGRGMATLPIVPGADHFFAFGYAVDEHVVYRYWGPTDGATAPAFEAPTLEPMGEVAPIDFTELARPRFGWASGAAGDPGDQIRVSWEFAGIEGPDYVEFIGRMPPTSAGQMQFPELPADFAEFLPESDSLYPNYSVTRMDYDDAAGYEDAINLPAFGGDRMEIIGSY